ncbi:hypothetical protein T484DRAFT_1752426 [Baffinella frigidus]|nr:hypothetical protein T484DRAFT_1752426 [Cryptophyta sp. CCMP2293]
MRSLIILSGVIAALVPVLAATPLSALQRPHTPSHQQFGSRSLRACPRGGRLLATVPVWQVRSPELAFADELREQMVNYVTENWNRASAGFKGMWANWGKVRDINKRLKEGGEMSYEEFRILQRDRTDTGKLIRMVITSPPPRSGHCSSNGERVRGP